jgi:hypothetical protein
MYINIAGLAMAAEAYNSLTEVEIDADGRFKYVLIRATDSATKAEKMLVRGFKWANYHGT